MANSMEPLAERMRPRSLDEYAGQRHILGDGTLLKSLLKDVESKRLTHLPSMVLWGPPGTGKTTLARLISQKVNASFKTLSATSSGVKDLRIVIEEAKVRRDLENKATVLFIDEIHRFNKGQQDALLPVLEDGLVSLIGATTENPSFELNKALLSRTRVFVLEQLPIEALEQILNKALADVSRGVGDLDIELSDGARKALLQLSDGDARTMLNALEWLALRGHQKIEKAEALEALEKNPTGYDRNGEDRFNLISAFQKSIRHSDPDASLYYLARMIEGGEDPMYVVRRLVRIASEDIGLADPNALTQAIAAKQTVEFLGMPESDAALAQVTTYLALAPKSNAVYEAVASAKQEVKNSGSLPIPLHLRNAPTKLLKDLGYGVGYKYDHNHRNGVARWEALPEEIKGKSFYKPKDIAFERDLKKRLEYFQKHQGKVLDAEV